MLKILAKNYIMFDMIMGKCAQAEEYMKNRTKILSVILVIAVILGVFTIPVNATTVPSFSEIVNQGRAFTNQTPVITEGEAVAQLVPVGQILVGIASVVLVCVGLVMGAKYMWAGANERAQLKQKLIWYVISIVVVYGGIGIFLMLRQVMETVLA